MANTEPVYKKITVSPMYENMDEVKHRPIDFEFEDVDYVVDFSAYKIGLILLPDGRTITPMGWLETVYPPFPLQLNVVENNKKAVPAKLDTRVRKTIPKK